MASASETSEETIFRYCPACASPALRFENGRRWVCPDCGFTYYHNVAASAAAVIDLGGSIVLLRRAREPRRGFLALPGGFVDPGEGALECALRECREEIGWAPARLDFLASFPNSYRYRDIPYATCDMYFCARLPSAEGVRLTADPAEAAEIALLPYGAIPWDDIAFPPAAMALRAYLRGLGAASALADAANAESRRA
jgi:ADP-ribose pyrophosphatase YjhB (NUDIX family)